MNKYNEFTDAERKLSDLLLQVSEEDLKEKEIQFKPVDYSFMEEIESAKVEYRCEKPVVKKHYSRHLIRAAAILLCIATLIFGCSFWLISQEVEADDFSLEKMIHQIKDGLYGTVEGNYVDENTTSIIITSLDDIETAKRFAPDLKVPGWLPEGTELVELTVVKDIDEKINASWILNMDSVHYYINQMPYDNQSDLMLKNVVESFDFEGKMFYITQDPLEEYDCISVILEDVIISLLGEITNEELIEVMKGMI